MGKTYREYLAEISSIGSVLNPKGTTRGTVGTNKPVGTQGTSSFQSQPEQEEDQALAAEITQNDGALEPDVAVIVPNADGTANNAVVQQDMGDRVNVKRDDGTSEIIDKEELMLLQQDLEMMKRRAGI